MRRSAALWVTLVLIFDRQHGDKGRAGKFDTGAVVEAGDGTQLVEVLLTEVYLRAAMAAAEEAGEPIAYFESGAYTTRHRRARALAEELFPRPCAYVAGHLNAGPPEAGYGALFYDFRSSGGARLANYVLIELARACPELDSVKAIPARPDDWTKNAYYTIKGIFPGPSNLSAICAEPAFLTSPEHRELLTAEGLKRIGEAIARGCLSWARD